MKGFDVLWRAVVRSLAFTALGLGGVSAQQLEARLTTFGPAGAPERSMQEWVELFQRAPHTYSFKGVFMVSLPKRASVSSSRIVHWAQQGHVMERIEALQGDERITLREGQQLMGVFPAEKVVRVETLQRLDWSSPVASLPMRVSPHYKVVPGAKARVAGWESHVVEFRALDAWRLSYRIWSDAQRGLILKMQTLSPLGEVLEQREFVELLFEVPEPSIRQFKQEIKQLPAGYRVLKLQLNKASLDGEGWQLGAVPAGFELMQCFTREGVPALQWMQCVFSDGMSSASVFIEQIDEKKSRRMGRGAWGATHTVIGRYQQKNEGWWMTAVGEVPLQTLSALIDSLQRGASLK